MKDPARMRKVPTAVGTKVRQPVTPTKTHAWRYTSTDRRKTHDNQATVRMVQHASTDAGKRFPPSRPLDGPTRELMESRLGWRFDQVKIHADTWATEQARDLRARAFTVGQHIVFGEGAYQPGTARGQALLAHELTHVAQPRAAGQLVSKPGDASELEADRAARSVVNGAGMRVGTVAGAAIQRQALPGVMSGKLDPPSPDALIENASPLLARALGSTTLDDFDTGKAELKGDHQRKLTTVAHAVDVLLRKYGTSTIEVIGFADTVGTESKNLDLGQNRADVVKQALIDRGVPEGMIAATSKGEGGPQAVRTRDKVPSAANRRVEVRFHPGKSYPSVLGGTLTTEPPEQGDPIPRPPKEFEPFGKGGIETKVPKGTLDPDPDPDPGPDPTPPPPDYSKPIPPSRKDPTSTVDRVSEKIVNPAVDKFFGWLSKSNRDALKKKGREAVERGIPRLAREAAELMGVSNSTALGGLEKAVEAAIKEKGQPEAPVDEPSPRLPPEPRNP